MNAPVLLTERLRLDGHRIDDLDPLTDIWAQRAVHALIGDGRPPSREDVWQRLLRSVGQWTLLGYGQWVMRDRASGALVGEAGLIDARRIIQPALDAPETGWLLAPSAQGRGLAREALAAILDWADARPIPRTLCIIDAANAASIRLAARVGYAPAGTTVYRDRPLALYARHANAASAA